MSGVDGVSWGTLHSKILNLSENENERKVARRGETRLDHGAIVDCASGGIEGRLELRLSCGRQHSLPGSSQWIHHPRRREHKSRDRDVDHTIIHETDTEGCVSRHSPMDGILREEHAVE